MKKIRLKEGLPERKFALRKVCFKKSSIVEERAVRTIHSDDDSLWEKPLLLRAPEVAASCATLVPLMAYRPHAEAAPYAVSAVCSVCCTWEMCCAE